MMHRLRPHGSGIAPRTAWLPPLSLLAACAGQHPASSGSHAGADQPAVQLARFPGTPCEWIPTEAVVAIVGPLEGEPQVVRSLDHPDPDSTGSACRYNLALPATPGTNAVLLHVDVTGNIIGERVGGAMVEGFREMIQRDTEAGEQPAEVKAPPPGWDGMGSRWTGFSSFGGRVGHVTVSVASLTPHLAADRAVALASRVRDAIPDLPFPNPPDPVLEALNAARGEPPREPPSGPDPCGLISASDAEAVLGKLVVPPYRSADISPLADPEGLGCSYFTAGHRVFTVRPHWDDGKMQFDMVRGVGGLAGGLIPDRTAAVADTLEGPWDDAATLAMTGQLYFLKGDQMLEIGYVTSSTDPAGAVRLARSAIARMGSAR
jgi:hypothetical protein